jgi:limonene-1,2-epoxide hydrolase
MDLHPAIAAFIAAVQRRDIEAVCDCLTEDVRYANVPHEPVLGKDGVRTLLGPFLERCDAARWDVVSAGIAGDTAFAERVDRFWIDGREYWIECAGVYRIVDGRIAEVRDYVDLGVWRERLGTVMARPPGRDRD